MGTFTKKMTALFLIVSVAVMLSLFSACNRGGDDENPEETTKSEEKEPVIHKVGFIYWGTVENSTQNLIFENGRTQLEKNLGVETYFIENVFVTNFTEAVDLLSENGVTVIVSTSPAFSNVVKRAAENNKSIKFISFGDTNTLSNLATFRPLLYQPANVCGLAAAFNSEADTLGIVADNNMYNCYGVVNAYIEGAKEVRQTNFGAYVNYVSSDNRGEVRRAIDDLIEKGNDVIMLYLSTDYGIKYCEELGVKAVAFAGNLPELAPNNYLTGFSFNVDSYLTEQVRFIQNDAFSPGTTVGQLGTGLVQMIRLNNIVYDGTEELTDFLYDSLTKNDRVFVGKLIDSHGTVVVQHGITLTYKEVLEMDWLDACTNNKVEKFSDAAVEELELVPLVVRGSVEG